MHKLVTLVLAAGSLAFGAKTLDFYFVDVEGGQATLIVTPAKQSMLVDTGFPGLNGRDATRIADAAKKAGLKHIDYLVITHYHSDHVGGVTQLLEKIPVKNFVDHGPNNETGKAPGELWAAYEKAFATGKRLVVKPGDKIPFKGADIQVVAADGQRIGGSNTTCTNTYPEDKTENARSLGFVLSFGKFRFLDLGDLTLQKEAELVCGTNPLGKIDLYLTTHHGMNTSNEKSLLQAIEPRVALMNNGAKKGGSPDAWKLIRSAPGIEDIWQVHYSLAGGKEHNAPDSFVANIEERCEGKWLKVSAEQSGAFTVTNSRNNYSKSYKAR